LKQIKLSDGNITIVDDDVYDWANKIRWNNNGLNYVVTGRGNTKKYLHRMITECPPEKVVDHINMNTFDNRRENLRIVTRSINNRNNLGKGYHFHKQTQKWCAQLKRDGKKIYIGLFVTEQEAKEAVRQFKDKEQAI
jgi:hypothetical protein